MQVIFKVMITQHPMHLAVRLISAIKMISSSFYQEISTSGFMVCMKDLQPYNEHHDPVNVAYLAIGGRATFFRLDLT